MSIKVEYLAPPHPHFSLVFNLNNKNTSSPPNPLLPHISSLSTQPHLLMESHTLDHITQPALPPTSPENMPTAGTPPPSNSSFHYTSCGFKADLNTSSGQKAIENNFPTQILPLPSFQEFALAPSANLPPALSPEQPILNSKIQQITREEFNSNISKAKSTMKALAALKLPKWLKDKIAKFSEEIEASKRGKFPCYSAVALFPMLTTRPTPNSYSQFLKPRVRFPKKKL